MIETTADQKLQIRTVKLAIVTASVGLDDDAILLAINNKLDELTSGNFGVMVREAIVSRPTPQEADDGFESEIHRHLTPQ
jgi:hypothetical protein